ncbi:DUF2807 domain-containing protein [Reichenbachiella ulvae]|uniref:DUF2807 domain-containing protein n=1 Tax=Reichenbachiella ulvae TaxID=2980104 RepID=A0ABT3CRT9_9BACT|nr:DUF2807 domain-containing protein [Reichenbachiella ulvae]MCV9386426.1 DUF2807 domain-containing protein [Reichenbachiella ulvae]
MKTSKKILLTFTGVLIALLICGMMLLRSDLEALPNIGYEYETVSSNQFHSIKVDGNWSIKLRQRAQHKVEVEGRAKDIMNKLFKVDNGVLMITKHENPENQALHLRISSPLINKIDASNGTEIYMDGFDSDSLEIRLENNSSFISSENMLEKTTIETSGNSWIQLIDDPMK